MKGPLAAVTAVAAAAIAAAIPSSRAVAYPGAHCFDQCNAAYGRCEYRSHAPNAPHTYSYCRRMISGCTRQCYKMYYRNWNGPASDYFHPRQRFKNPGMVIPRGPNRSDGVRIPGNRVTPYSLRVR